MCTAILPVIWRTLHCNDCITVDLASVEVANVARKRVRHSGQEIIRSGLADAQAFVRETCHVVPARDLMPATYDLACSHGITIYDALFVAAAGPVRDRPGDRRRQVPRRSETSGDHATGPLTRTG